MINKIKKLNISSLYEKNFWINNKKIILDKIKINKLVKKFNYLRQNNIIGKTYNQISLDKIEPNRWIKKLKDFSEKAIARNSNEVVLKDSTYWASAISWSIMGGTVFGLSWLAFAKTEEIVIAQGKLEPINGVVDVQMPFEGIIGEILVEEGEKVEKGQILLKLDTEVTDARRKALSNSLLISKDLLERYKALVKEGAIAEIQLLDQQNKISELESRIAESNVTLKYQSIIAPSNGIVFDLKPKASGFVGRTTEPVMKIVPIEKLKATVEIASKDIGFVSVGKSVDISIDSFPATDFGVIHGQVTKIGSDALVPEPSQNKGFRFPADIKLESQHLILKNKKRLPLQTGMSLTANIKLRKVSYLQLLLNNFEDKADSLRAL
ncbi:HlyD family secretion protein [Prochlorococcus sp. MIT 0801]|uniref:HlyD family secretion protein n=1 Tax=Prochlorococcus sp. MIT 0801 TaxID=1501269 RepID=UPI0004F817E4|nr:HlyD family efflux transporter periplasmic adaptor subunit [Prochlorococcus sp. MIT 0801]AIQ98263.1 putative transporter component [Prochlorococcus sp. MIT 0801]